MIRRIRDLLYDQGFTISGARNKMQEVLPTERVQSPSFSDVVEGLEVIEATNAGFLDIKGCPTKTILTGRDDRWLVIYRELREIRNLLSLSV